MSKNTTTIELSTDNWGWMNRKKDKGDSFNDVLDRMVKTIELTGLGINEEYPKEYEDLRESIKRGEVKFEDLLQAYKRVMDEEDDV